MSRLESLVEVGSALLLFGAALIMLAIGIAAVAGSIAFVVWLTSMGATA